MRFCSDHWATLKDAIRERGLYDLVASDGTQAAKNMAAEMTEGPAITNFDPLMTAHNAILANAMDAAGLAIMAQNEDGSDRCPLCYLNTGHDERWPDGCPELGCPGPKPFDVWIGYGADGAKAVYERLLAEAPPPS